MIRGAILPYARKRGSIPSPPIHSHLLLSLPARKSREIVDLIGLA